MATASVNRRDFMRVLALGSGLAAATACAGATPAPAEPTAVPPATAAPSPPAEPAAPASKYAEAPMLAEKVAAGELPPVEERLPSDPLVVECIEEPGEYSGDLRRALTGPADIGGYRAIVRESLAGWDYRSGKVEVIPNLASGWDITDDGATYVFHLRKGARWSDGELFTADDIMFWYEHMVLNEELTPTFPGWLTVAGEPGVIEKIDDYTVAFKFAAPYGILLEYLCFSGQQILTPRHYLSQFHPDFADADELSSKVKDAGFEHWYQLLANRNDYTNNPDLPVLFTWKLETPFPAQRMVSVRNPYYWKVDTNGKQLPYFDRLVTELAQDPQLVLMKAIAGEVDFQWRHMGFTDYSLLKENEETGDYSVLEWIGGGLPTVYVNQSVSDLELRKIFQTKDFRHALSWSINRDAMNDLFWHGLAMPGNPPSVKTDYFWREGFGQTAVAYNVDRANELLDGIGLDQRDGDGWRLRPDGQRLQLLLDVYPGESGAPNVDIFGQVAEYWRAVGLETQLKEMELTLWLQRAIGNESMMPAYTCAPAVWEVDARWYVPNVGNCYWAPAYGQWVASGGASGEEPPDEFKQLVEWYEALKSELDREKRLELGAKILAQHSEQVYMVGICALSLQPCIKKNDLVNVLGSAPAQDRTNHEQISWPWQVWRRQS